MHVLAAIIPGFSNTAKGVTLEVTYSLTGDPSRPPVTAGFTAFVDPSQNEHKIREDVKRQTADDIASNYGVTVNPHLIRLL